MQRKAGRGCHPCPNKQSSVQYVIDFARERGRLADGNVR